MALANFFDRAEQALHSALQTVNPIDLCEYLKKNSVGMIFDDDSLNYRNNEIILELTINLLSRLYPKVGVLYSGTKDIGFKKVNDLEEIARQINPNIEFDEKATDYKGLICLGKTEFQSLNCIYLKADSWNIEISINKVPNSLLGNTFNPISASAVACFGVGELFKIYFEDLLGKEYKSKGFILSLLNYSKNESSNYELPDVIKFNDLNLVGIGAVGNVIPWVLKWFPKIEGNITLIDPECIEKSNLQRYVISNQNNIDKSKVEIAKSYLEYPDLNVNSFQLSLGEYVNSYNKDCNFDIIAIAVDNVDDRIAAQALLPKIIFNAWTGEQGYLGVSRHTFDDYENACLACLYLNTNQKKSLVDEIAEVTGFDVSKTTKLVLNNVPLSEELLNEISQIRNIPYDILGKYVGESILEFYRKAICGGALIAFNQSSKREVVPLAHQSALSGVLLICEIIKYNLKLIPEKTPIETRLNVLDSLPDYFYQNRKKTSNPKCICCDEDYLNIYHKKYNNE